MHRGLRNGVVYVEERGGTIALKLSTFSFATFVGERLPVPEGAVFGTPAWMSPPLRAAGTPPSPLDAICMKLLSKSVDDRFASATELLKALLPGSRSARPSGI